MRCRMRSAMIPKPAFPAPSASMRYVLEIARRVCDEQLALGDSCRAGRGKGATGAGDSRLERRSPAPYAPVSCTAIGGAEALEAELLAYRRATRLCAGFSPRASRVLRRRHAGPPRHRQRPAVASAQASPVSARSRIRAGGRSHLRARTCGLLRPRASICIRRCSPARFARSAFWRWMWYDLIVPPARARRRHRAYGRSLPGTYSPRTAGLCPGSTAFSDDALDALLKHSYPGNTRRAAHLVERRCFSVTGRTWGWNIFPETC